MKVIVLKITKKYHREVFTVALVLVVLLGFWTIQQAQGAAFTGERVLLQSSIPATASWQEHRFVIPAAWAVSTTFFIDLGGLFTTPPDGVEDFDIEFGVGALESANQSEVSLLFGTGAPPDIDDWQVVITNNTRITFRTASDGASIPSANHTVYIEIGTQADFGGAGDTSYTNPAKISAEAIADTYTITYDYNAAVDTGAAMVAVIEGVTVSATVSESLSVTVGTVSSGDCDTSFTSENDASANATAISFGPISTDTFYHGCLDWVVSTNAANGFSATAESNSALQIVSTTTTIEFFTVTAATANPTTAYVWGATNTYGFGYTCDDENGGTVCNTDFTSGANNSYRPFADKSLGTPEDPAEFLSSSTATASTSRIDYRLKTVATQAAGDYTNILTYIFTPTF